MQRLLPRLIALAALGVAGCRGSTDDGSPKITPMPPTLAGVYAGRFPCSNCTAIEATLWLREDGRFFLRQTLTDGEGDDTRSDAPTFALGRWHWDEEAAEAVLRGAGPERHITALDSERLRLRVASPIEHVLQRDAASPPFADRLTLDGESSVTDQGAVFVECLSGLRLTVAEDGAYRELRRQHRRLNPRGNVALTTIEGRLVTTGAGDATSETLVIERVVTLKPGTSC